MSLNIRKTVFEEMVKVAQEAIPLEACGLLAGKDSRVTRLYSLTNADASPTHCRMVPEPIIMLPPTEMEESDPLISQSEDPLPTVATVV